MKKFICILLVATMTAIFAAAACADTPTAYEFSFPAGTTRGTSQDFGFSRNYKEKLDINIDYIAVRHEVSESAMGYTNLIAADCQNTGTYLGSKWMSQSPTKYYATNGGCSDGLFYAPCGRGNTKYSDNLGITAVTISGMFRVY